MPRRGCVAELAANNAQVFVGLAALLELYVKDHQLPWSDQSRIRLQDFIPWAAPPLGPLSLPEDNPDLAIRRTSFDEAFLKHTGLDPDILDYLRESWKLTSPKRVLRQAERAMLPAPAAVAQVQDQAAVDRGETGHPDLEPSLAHRRNGRCAGGRRPGDRGAGQPGA